MIVLSFLLLITIGWLGGNFFFNPITTIFHVTVHTERLVFTTLDNNSSRLGFYHAEVATLDSTLFPYFNGSFELETGVRVTIDRLSEGPIYILLEKEQGAVLGTLYDELENRVVQPRSFFEIVIQQADSIAAQGEPFVFPVEGEIELGRSVDIEIYSENKPLLREGEITLTGNSKIGNQYFEAGTEKVRLGDKLIFEEQQGEAYGFVAVNENPGMQAAYRVKARKARIVKPGPKDEQGGYTISASNLDRVLKDKLFIGLSIVFGFSLAVLTVITFYMDATLFLKERKKNEN